MATFTPVTSISSGYYLYSSSSGSPSNTKGEGALSVTTVGTLSSFILNQTHTGPISYGNILTASAAGVAVSSLTTNGNTTVSSALTVKKGVTLNSEGGANSLTVGASGSTGLFTCHENTLFRGSTNTYSRGLTFSSGASSGFGAPLLKSSDATFYPLTFSTYGIYVDSTHLHVKKDSGNTSVVKISLTDGSIVGSGGTITGFSSVANAVWGDYSDWIAWDRDEDALPGRCYVMRGTTYELSSRRAEIGTLGIVSDTASFTAGREDGSHGLNIAVSGYVLAYVDRVYRPGTPLVSYRHGMLTRARLTDRLLHPERIVGTYMKKEPSLTYHGLVVDGRAWVKVS